LSLLSATLIINGGWILPLCFPLLLSGCGGEPEATYETDSSQVDIHGLDEDTDLEALINITGLDPSVQETLSRLRGQRVAIVTLQTQPLLSGSNGSSKLNGQPGIHLSWTTALVSQSTQSTYSYPLGTGASWAHPIELTRVYVVAPPGIDFTVQYPRLGTNYSGFARTLFYPLIPRITGHYDMSAYAVDEARGDNSHWFDWPSASTGVMGSGLALLHATSVATEVPLGRLQALARFPHLPGIERGGSGGGCFRINHAITTDSLERCCGHSRAVCCWPRRAGTRRGGLHLEACV